MRILILGGSTFVGRRIVAMAVEQGHHVSVLNRGKTASDMPEGVSRIIGDRTDNESMNIALGNTEWDSIIDVSGFVMTAGAASFTDLIDLVDGRTGSYVFVSSIMAYAESGFMPWTEDMPWRDEPVTTYGGFKAHAEQVLLERHARTGLAASVARPAAIYGPHNNIHDMETAMFLRLRRGLPILVPHDGLVTGSYGHVDDLCASLLYMAGSANCAGEIVNVTGEGLTVNAYIEGLSEIVGKPADVIYVPTEQLSEVGQAFGHLFKSRHHGVLSNEKARRLSLPAERGFMRGHAQTYEWFCSTDLVNAPDQLADPVWKAGYDFAHESQIATRLRP